MAWEFWLSKEIMSEKVLAARLQVDSNRDPGGVSSSSKGVRDRGDVAAVSL
jgi:hypothetical protein